LFEMTAQKADTLLGLDTDPLAISYIKDYELQKKLLLYRIKYTRALEGMLFYINAEPNSNVYLMGEYNKWADDGTKIKLSEVEPGLYAIVVSKDQIGSGGHTFKFIVEKDGKRTWTPGMYQSAGDRDGNAAITLTGNEVFFNRDKAIARYNAILAKEGLPAVQFEPSIMPEPTAIQKAVNAATKLIPLAISIGSLFAFVIAVRYFLGDAPATIAMAAGMFGIIRDRRYYRLSYDEFAERMTAQRKRIIIEELTPMLEGSGKSLPKGFVASFLDAMPGEHIKLVSVDRLVSEVVYAALMFNMNEVRADEKYLDISVYDPQDAAHTEVMIVGDISQDVKTALNSAVTALNQMRKDSQAAFTIKSTWSYIDAKSGREVCILEIADTKANKRMDRAGKELLLGEIGKTIGDRALHSFNGDAAIRDDAA